MKLQDLAQKLLTINPDTCQAPCADDCYQSKGILVVSGPRPTVLDAWCEAVREESGEKLDWHYMGGRAVFRSPGDYQKIAQAIHHLLPALQWVYALETEEEGNFQLQYSWCDYYEQS